MTLLSDSMRLAMLKAAGAEQFDTGKSSRLWGTFEGEFNEPEVTGLGVEGEMRWIECRQSDKATHELVKRTRLVRVSTGEELFVKRFEPSSSSGFLIIRLMK